MYFSTKKKVKRIRIENNAQYYYCIINNHIVYTPVQKYELIIKIRHLIKDNKIQHQGRQTHVYEIECDQFSVQTQFNYNNSIRIRA